MLSRRQAFSLPRVRSKPAGAHQTEKPLHAPRAEHPTQGHEKSPYKPNKDRVQSDGLVHRLISLSLAANCPEALTSFLRQWRHRRSHAMTHRGTRGLDSFLNFITSRLSMTPEPSNSAS